MKLHWLRCDWSKWSEPIQQGMKLLPSETTWKSGPDTADYYRWLQERKCLACNKMQRRQINVY